jgi:nitrite reductase (NADH) large subunit
MQTQAKSAQHSDPFVDGVIIVGAGPTGMRAAQELVRAGRAVTVLSAEAHTPYNRVRLTPLLSGDVQIGEIALCDDRELPAGLNLEIGKRVVRIDRERSHVVTADGAVWPYAALILATGSDAFVPAIPGRDLPGVYTFRTADDASALLARSFSARRVAVIGGGLLGLEAARGMKQRQCDVSVIEHASHLMPRQLDEAGGDRLAEKIKALGVNVATGVAVKSILGPDRVTGLQLNTGEQIACDTVIICTGVRPNIDLARQARLAFSRGVVVNAAMQTSDPKIYAIGECAEHNGRLYGLVGPGYAQAEAAAASVLGQVGQFKEAAPVTKLKVIGADVLSVGDIEQLEVRQNVRSHAWEEGGAYRRIFVDRGTLVGAIAVGAWDQSSRIQDAVQNGGTLYPWMLYRFRKTGSLWPASDLAADEMHASATLCNCTGATCGQVRSAIQSGCASVAAVGNATGAGTVCGTCRPLLAEVIDAGADPEPLPLWQPMLGLSAVAGLIALAPLITGHVPTPDSFDADSLRTWLWQDNIVKQWSGFILLGITAASFLIGLRKRFRFMDRLGRFEGWRVVHSGLGIAALAALFAHTGFNPGNGLNAMLALCFLAVVLLGALAGLATGGDHVLRARRIGSARKPPRKAPVWAHILLLWPLPVLILFHVLASYAF